MDAKFRTITLIDGNIVYWIKHVSHWFGFHEDDVRFEPNNEEGGMFVGKTGQQVFSVYQNGRSQPRSY